MPQRADKWEKTQEEDEMGNYVMNINKFFALPNPVTSSYVLLKFSTFPPSGGLGKREGLPLCLTLPPPSAPY